MAFTVEDFRDLTRLLEAKPEWRSQIRRLVLSDEFGELPEDLAALRLATERRFDKVSRAQAQFAEDLAALRQTQAQFAEDLAALRQTQAQFTEDLAALRRDTERRFQEVAGQIGVLTESQEQVVKQLAELTRATLGLVDDVGRLKGSDLERRYRERAFAHFGSFIRRARVLTDDELADMLETGVADGLITEAEADEVTWADVVVRGRRRDTGDDACLVVKVSWGVGPSDIDRALRRARILGRLASPVLPVVAGETATAEADRRARSEGVWQLLQGRVVAPEVAPAD